MNLETISDHVWAAKRMGSRFVTLPTGDAKALVDIARVALSLNPDHLGTADWTRLNEVLSVLEEAE